MDNDYREVRFDIYCDKCKHDKLKEVDEPCLECLDNPTNEYSDIPINFEKKEK